MWKAIICILLVLIGLTGEAVDAGESEDITITSVPYIAGAPVGFTLTYISDTDILIEWTKGADAENTQVRAKYGEYPQGINDGYLVYLGSGEEAHDTALNLDETASNIYYRAWSQNASGVWAEYYYGEDNIGGVWVTLIAFIILGLAFIAVAYIFKQPMFLLLDTIVWLIFGFIGYNMSFPDNDYMHIAVAGLGFLMAFVVAVLAVMQWLRTRTPRMSEFDEDAEIQRRHSEVVRGLTRPRSQERSWFDSTGEE